MESAEGKKSDVENPDSPLSQLCVDVKTETCTTIDGGTSFGGDVSLVDEQNGEILIKTIKEEEPDAENDPYGGTTLSVQHITHVDQQEEGFLKNPDKEEDEDYLYCEECKSFFTNKCEVHGPALFISDTPVPVGAADRARQTLPPGLEIWESSIPDAGLGVFNNGETIPIGMHFGPYEGEVVDREEAMSSGYSWVIYKSKQCEEYIDATRETHSNWMRYVNCARNNEEHNLVVFQYQGRIFYRCCRPITPAHELLVWHEERHSKDLSTTFHCLWNKKCSAEETKGYSCSLCVFSYTSQLYLHKHIKSRHHNEYVRLLKSGEIKYENLMPTSSSCDQDTFSASLSNNSFPRRAKKEIHHCSHCGKSFIQKGTLQVHQRIHTGEKPYHCSTCGKSFTQKNHLERHERIHTGEKPYDCSQCGKSFTDTGTLQRHQQVHTGKKPYHCSLCGKSFARQDGFQSHQRVHTGEKPYRCSECERSFGNSRLFRMHKCSTKLSACET